MKKTLLILFMISMISCNQNGEKVIVCTGKYSKRYHSSVLCKGIKNCKGSIKMITLNKAIESGKTACGYCYRQINSNDDFFDVDPDYPNYGD